MESSIAVFLMRQLAYEQLPTKHITPVLASDCRHDAGARRVLAKLHDQKKGL